MISISRLKQRMIEGIHIRLSLALLNASHRKVIQLFLLPLLFPVFNYYNFYFLQSQKTILF